MRLEDLCVVSDTLKMVLYDTHFGVEFARIDGKNGVSERVLDSEIGRLSILDNWLCVETDFSVYHFICDCDNWQDLKDKIIASYIDYIMLKGSKSIFKPGKTKIIKVLMTPKGVKMYSVDSVVYSDKEFKDYILNDDEFLLYATNNWGCYELEWGL